MKVRAVIEFDMETGQFRIDANAKGPVMLGVLQYALESFKVQQLMPEMMPRVIPANFGNGS